MDLKEELRDTPEQVQIVDRARVAWYIRERKASLETAKKKPNAWNVQDATDELLDELVHAPRPLATRSLVRDGRRVILGEGSHQDIAITAGMESADDACLMKKDLRGRLAITEGSLGLKISANNNNRPETWEILHEIAPNVPIVLM